MRRFKLFKTVFSVCFLSLFVSFSAQAKKTWHIHKEGGKVTSEGVKYRTVVQTIKGDLYKLDCKGRGPNLCTWTVVPSITDGTVTSEEVEHFVKDQIHDGKNNGSINFNNKVHVSWEYNPDTDVLDIYIQEI